MQYSAENNFILNSIKSLKIGLWLKPGNLSSPLSYIIYDICILAFCLKEILGERIHVRIIASLNGVPGVSLKDRYLISARSCLVRPKIDGSHSISIIEDGQVLSNLPFPVSVDHDPGHMGGGIPFEEEGIGFSFQMFTFQAGTALELM